MLSDTIRQLRADGTTLIVVEHKIGSLLQLVDRVVAMDQGASSPTVSPMR